MPGRKNRCEFEHLAKLGTGQSFPYRMHAGFDKKLRHLLALHFINIMHDFKTLGMPGEADLQEYFTNSNADGQDLSAMKTV